MIPVGLIDPINRGSRTRVHYFPSGNQCDNGLFMPNWAKIYLGDSRAMTEVEDAAIDLAVTSPPYYNARD